MIRKVLPLTLVIWLLFSACTQSLVPAPTEALVATEAPAATEAPVAEEAPVADFPILPAEDFTDWARAGWDGNFMWSDVKDIIHIGKFGGIYPTNGVKFVWHKPDLQKDAVFYDIQNLGDQYTTVANVGITAEGYPMVSWPNGSYEIVSNSMSWEEFHPMRMEASMKEKIEAANAALDKMETCWPMNETHTHRVASSEFTLCPVQ